MPHVDIQIMKLEETLSDEGLLFPTKLQKKKKKKSRELMSLSRRVSADICTSCHAEFEPWKNLPIWTQHIRGVAHALLLLFVTELYSRCQWYLQDIDSYAFFFLCHVQQDMSIKAPFRVAGPGRNEAGQNEPCACGVLDIIIKIKAWSLAINKSNYHHIV